MSFAFLSKRRFFISDMLTTIFRLLLFVMALLAIPLVAMQLTDEVVWTVGDFAVAALLLTVSGAIMLYVWSYARLDRRHKWLAIGLMVVCFLFIWAELAVGILP